MCGCPQAVAAGMNPMDLRKGIKLATDHVVTVLSDISKPISTKEEVAQVGTISANRCTLDWIILTDEWRAHLVANWVDLLPCIHLGMYMDM